MALIFLGALVTGEPHRWYAHEELMPVPGAQPGQRVGREGQGDVP
jgi:hypothetical protein